MDKQKTLALEKFGYLAIEAIKAVVSSGKKLTTDTLIEGLSSHPDAIRWFEDQTQALSQSHQTSDTALVELQGIKQQLAKSRAQKDDLVQQITELEENHLKADAFYRASLAVCSRLLQSSENNHVIAPLKNFSLLLKKKAPLGQLQNAFQKVKDATLQDDVRSSTSLGAGTGKSDPHERSAVSDQRHEENYLKKLKELHQEILVGVRLNIDKTYLADLGKIENRIKESKNIEDFLSIRRDILSLIKEYSEHAVEEREQAATFFKQISNRLGEVESHILASLNVVEENHLKGQQHDDELHSQLQAISESANFSQDLNELRHGVLSRLEVIQNAFKKKRSIDLKRMGELKQKMGELKSNFSSLKKEVDSARQRADHLEQELLLDPLTGIYNRRAYDKHLKEELQRYQRYNQQFSMLLFDVDHFKRINDTYGHAIGDRCLKEIINRIKTILRESDFLARVGGEEFVVILPGTFEKPAVEVAEKVRRAVEKTEFIHNNETLPITISVGVTAVRSSDHSSGKLFQRVDKAMYEAKNTGRNRVAQLF